MLISLQFKKRAAKRLIHYRRAKYQAAHMQLGPAGTTLLLVAMRVDIALYYLLHVAQNGLIITSDDIIELWPNTISMVLSLS